MIKSGEQRTTKLKKHIVTHSSIDNIDQETDTLSIHFTSSNLFQTQDDTNDNYEELSVESSHPGSSEDILSFELNQLVYSPTFPNFIDDTSIELITKWFETDILWSIVGGIPEKICDPLDVPLLGSWTHFNKKVSSKEFKSAVTQYMPTMVPRQFPDGHFPDGHFPNGQFPDGQFPNGHFHKQTFPQTDISPNGHFPKRTFPRTDISPNGHFPERTFPRTDISQNGHFPERTFPRTDISPNGHFPERTFPRTDISPNGHFPERTFPQTDISQTDRHFPDRRTFPRPTDISPTDGHFPERTFP